MKEKHLRARIAQCLALAACSPCPRRKFGAVLLDPVRNVVLMDGYNGAPRGGGDLCGGVRCLRDGLLPEDVVVTDCQGIPVSDAKSEAGAGVDDDTVLVRVKDQFVMEPHMIDMRRAMSAPHTTTGPKSHGHRFWLNQATACREQLLAENPPIKSGTRMEIGCHHAEMNIICNVAASTVSSVGAWLIVTGEPCLMCAKHIHHAGIVKVLVVKGGYIGENGVAYLRENGVLVEEVEGPQDPRSSPG